MLKAFSVPLTPQGKSALATLPPWHYSSDCIAIEYWTDPAAIAALLPPGLTPDKKSGGRAFFWFLDWQFTGSNDELTDPARYQYREAFALVEVVFDGMPVNYCPYIFVDNDAALARGCPQSFRPPFASFTSDDSCLLSDQFDRGNQTGSYVADHVFHFVCCACPIRICSPRGGGPPAAEIFVRIWLKNARAKSRRLRWAVTLKPASNARR
jgi:hypothetical protein